MDPYRYGVFPCSCAYQHMLFLPVEISAAELRKWMKLWGKQPIVPAKSYNPPMIMPAQDQISPPVKISISIFGTVGQKNIQGIGRWFSDQFPDFLSFKLWRKWLVIIDQRYFQAIDSKAGFSHLQAAGFIMQDMDPGCLQLLFIFLISGCHTVLLRICLVQLIFMVSQCIINRILLSQAPQKR